MIDLRKMYATYSRPVDGKATATVGGTPKLVVTGKLVHRYTSAIVDVWDCIEEIEKLRQYILENALNSLDIPSRK